MNPITEEDIPDEFLCCITNEIMKDPVMSIQGFSFEREAIFEWLQTHSTCPLSRRELSVSKLVTNCALRERIRAWCDVHDMMHLLETDPNEDPYDPKRHLVLGIKITKEQREELQNNHTRRQNRVMRAMARLSRRGGGRSRSQVRVQAVN